MWAFLSDEVVLALPGLGTILTIYVADCRQVGCRHRLHSNGSVEECKIVTHILHRAHTQWTCVAMPATILREARQMHDMATLETLQRLCGLKEQLVANWARSLQLLWDAAMVFIGKGYTRVAPHTMAKVYTKTQSHPAVVAQ